MSDIKLDINIRDGMRLEAVSEEDWFVLAAEPMGKVFGEKVDELIYLDRKDEVRNFAAELITLGEWFMKRADGKR